MKDGEHYHNQGDPEGKHSHRKLAGIILLAVISAFVAYGVAQTALDTANINNVFSIVVNNTDLYPSQRTVNAVYYANDSPIAVYIIFHALGTGAAQTFDSNFSINSSVVLDRDFKTSAGSGIHDHWSFYTIVPKGSNYSVTNSTNVFSIEWREYPILSGRNGTLSVNQTFVTNGSSFNSTYDQTTKEFNSNYSSQTFPNSTIATNNNTLSNTKLNKTLTLYDNLTGNLQVFGNINATNATFLNGTINGNGTLLNGVIPTFNGWTANPGTAADFTNELGINSLTTSGTANAGTSPYIQYDLGVSKRIVVTSFAHVSAGAMTNAYIQFSDNGINYFIVWLSGGSTSGQTFTYLSTNAIGKARYIRFVWDIPTGGATLNVVQVRIYNI